MTMNGSMNGLTETREIVQPRNRAVKEFLQRFANALTEGEVDALTTMWAAPSFVLSDDMELAITSAEQVHRFFLGARDEYEAKGITQTRPDIRSIDWLTARIAVVTVRWPYLDDRGNEQGDETSTYLVKFAGEEPRIHAAVMHGASEPH